MSLLTDAYVSRQRKMKIMRQGRFKTEELSFISFAINTKLRTQDTRQYCKRKDNYTQEIFY